MDSSVALFGPIDTYLAPALIYVLLAVIVVNIASRALEYNRIADRAADVEDHEDISRHPVRVATNFLLVLLGFYFLTVDRHTGMVVTLFAVGVFLADFFEFEARMVEVRQGWEIERPWGSIGASLLVLTYIVYQIFDALFPFWKAVI